MMSYKQAKEKMAEIGEKLTATDNRFNRTVQLVTRDSSVVYQNSFVLQYHEWYFIFTEHHDYILQHIEDVMFCRQYGRCIPIDVVTDEV